MNIIPRYMKEYANAQRKSYVDNELMTEKVQRYGTGNHRTYFEKYRTWIDYN